MNQETFADDTFQLQSFFFQVALKLCPFGDRFVAVIRLDGHIDSKNEINFSLSIIEEKTRVLKGRND